MWKGSYSNGVVVCTTYKFKSPDMAGACNANVLQEGKANDPKIKWSIQYQSFRYTGGDQKQAEIMCRYEEVSKSTGASLDVYSGGCGQASGLMYCADGTAPKTSLPLAQQCSDSCAPPLIGFQPNCTCADGTAPVAGKCSDCQSNKNKTFNGYVKGVTSQPSVCQGGCNYNISSGELKYTAKVGGDPVVMGTWVSDGTICSTDTANVGIHDDGDTSKETPYSCAKKGMTSGNVNGTDVCLKPTKDNPLGITFGMTRTTNNNNIGSSQIDDNHSVGAQVTVIKDGTGSDKVTEVLTDGQKEYTDTGDIRMFCEKRPTHAACVTPSGIGSESAKTGTQDDFCGKNPQSPMCIKGAWSDQGCGQSMPSCQGDAVQCAQAKLQWQSYCSTVGDGTAATLGAAMGSGSDPLGADLPTPQNATQLDLSTQLKTSDSFLSGGCLQDTVVPFNGGTVKIPWSNYCVYFEYMGLVTMAVAGLISLRIIGVWS